MRLNFRYEDLLKLGEEFKAAFEGRMRWGDTLFLTLGGDESKYLVVWTPKESSESEHLPGFYTEDGKFFMKIKPKPGAWITYADLGNIRQGIAADNNVNKRAKQRNANPKTLKNQQTNLPKKQTKPARASRIENPWNKKYYWASGNWNATPKTLWISQMVL